MASVQIYMFLYESRFSAIYQHNLYNVNQKAEEMNSIIMRQVILIGCPFPVGA